MNPKEYIKNVLVTEARDMAPLQERFAQIRNIRILHSLTGLGSELSEVQEMVENPRFDGVNLKEEMGDLKWYMGIMVDELKFDPDQVFSNNEPGGIVAYGSVNQQAELQHQVHGMVKAIGTITDIAKKSLFYGKELNTAEILNQLQKLDYYINYSLRLYGQTSAQARERNIEKLRARYGEKFTEAAALERNLEAERAILEKK